MVVFISIFNNFKDKLNSQNHDAKSQKEIIDALKQGKPLHDVIKEDKEIIVKWYHEGRRGKELYSNFYNQLNQLASDDLILEDLSTIVESVKTSKQFINNRVNLILFNSPKVINQWYLKGRDGDITYKWFYSAIKENAFEEVIKYDEKLINDLLNDGIELEVALNSPKLFSTKWEFKTHDYGSLKPLVEKHSKEIVIDALKNNERFLDVIESEKVYNTAEEISKWYKQGREGNPQHVEFYKQALPFVVKQDYNNISEAIDEGTPIDDLLALPSVISSNKEFQDYLHVLDDESFETFIEQDTQKAILNSCKAGVPFKEIISKHVLKFNSRDIEIWYRLGQAGDSKYQDFYNKISPYVLKDDCEVVLDAVKKGKSLIEAIDESDLIVSKEFMKQLYSQDEFASGDIAATVNKTIEVIISNTGYSLIDFDFYADQEIIEQWVELGKLNIDPFKDFYDEYLVFKTQAKIVDSLKNNELFKNAIRNSELAYDDEVILDWFFKGKNGERFIKFYKECSEYVIEETKQGIIDYLERYHSFSQAIEKYDSLYTENEIRQWFNQGKNGEDHIEFYQTCVDIMNSFTDTIDSLDELLTPKYEEKLRNAVLTVEDYDKIIEEIYKIGAPYIAFEKGDSTFDKVSKVVNVYAPWSYKSRGGEYGSYMSNFIKIDDRLLDSQKISTLIHELTHHLVAEILEIAMCYMLDVEKTQAIEGFVAYFLTDPLTKIMNEYCASTVEGRFVPHGFQNYGSFEIIYDDCAAEDQIKELYKYIGNTFADDIIILLEKFIGVDLREEIKNQFINDRNIPSMEGIFYECTQTIDKEAIIAFLSEALVDYYNLAKDSDSHKKILKTAYNSFDSSYQ